MEVLLYHAGPSHVKLQLVDKKPSLFGLTPLEKRHQILCGTSRSRSLGISAGNPSIVKNSQQELSGLFKSARRHPVTLTRVSNESYSGYVAGGEGLEDISGVEESTEKVLIPGLPDESESAAISSGFWEWKPKLTVHYEKAGCDNVNSPVLLFLPGFGVGSFHYEKQLKDLGRDFRVWALDFLGQGKSLSDLP